jgi:sulfate transport system ATP-binding protein
VYVRATRVPPIPGGTELPTPDEADDVTSLTKA